MDQDFKYKLSHIGDIFVEGVESIIGKTFCSGTCFSHFMGYLEYSMKRPGINRKMGERLVEIHEEDPDHSIFEDDVLEQMFHRLDRLKEKAGLAEHKEKHEEKEETAERQESPSAPEAGTEPSSA